MTQQILTYGVTASVTSPGISTGNISGKSAKVEFDTSAGQSDSLPGPADLLVTAFAACVLKNVERMSSFMPFAYDGATIEVTAERETNPPRMARINYLLTVNTDEPERRVELLHRNISNQGTIYNTLAQVCEITGQIATERPASVSA